jgi:L-lactate dehydrogenase complex protein LldE
MEHPKGERYASRPFVPCYVDAFHPDVGIATLELLERLGIEVEYPLDQTCCGQPTTNSGCHAESAATEALFVRNFEKFDYIVGPSGSGVHHARYNLGAIKQTDAVRKVGANTFELVEFLHDVLNPLGVSASAWWRRPAGYRRVRVRTAATASGRGMTMSVAMTTISILLGSRW